jgi:hypothetical protein
MTRAELFLLFVPAQIGVRKGRAHGIAAMTIDDVNASGAEGAGPLEHMREHGPSGERLQHLGQAGIHALALAGGQDNNRQRHRIRSSEVSRVHHTAPALARRVPGMEDRGPGAEL